MLTLDRSDYGMMRLHHRLTSCAAFQMAVNGYVGSRHGFADKLCGQPECYHCRYRVARSESLKFHVARDDIIRTLDLVNGDDGMAGVPYGLNFVTINLGAYPLDLCSDEIENIRRLCRLEINRAFVRIASRYPLACFGHLECGPSVCIRDSGFDLGLVRQVSDCGLYTVLHWHGWVLGLGSCDDIRDLLCSIFPGNRRVCFRPRRDSQSFSESIRSVIGYGCKNLHSITDETSGDDEILFWISRWRKYLRGDGLRGSRISFNLHGIYDDLNSWWQTYSSQIFGLVVGDMWRKMPPKVQLEYFCWAEGNTLSDRQRGRIRNRYSYINWCLLKLAEILAKIAIQKYGTRFDDNQPRIWFQSRAPPRLTGDGGDFLPILLQFVTVYYLTVTQI